MDPTAKRSKRAETRKARKCKAISHRGHDNLIRVVSNFSKQLILGTHLRISLTLVCISQSTLLFAVLTTAQENGDPCRLLSSFISWALPIVRWINLFFITACLSSIPR